MKFIKRLENTIKQDSKIKPLNFINHVGSKDPLHVKRRQQQRAINKAMILICLTYGHKKRISKAWSYIIRDIDLKDTLYESYTNELRGLKIIGNWKEDIFEIYTCLWDFKIKRKRC